MKFALVLSGCGQHDGSETHEVILTLLSLAQESIAWEAFAPDVQQCHVVNHLTEKDESGVRNVMSESARLTRGKIAPINKACVDEYDAIIFPGGLGAVTNLCNWYEANKNFSFNKDVKKFIDAATKSNTPMGFICIAPIMVTKIYPGAEITIGNDADFAKHITELGSKHTECSATDIVIDYAHRIVSTPANMVAKQIDEVYEGIHKLVKALKSMAKT